jgi:D-alanine transaminase
MSRIAYVDGQYVPFRSATVDIEDRGYQLANGAYKVLALVDGRLADEDLHLARLGRSVAGLRIDAPLSNAALKIVMRQDSGAPRAGYLAHAAAA